MKIDNQSFTFVLTSKLNFYIERGIAVEKCSDFFRVSIYISIHFILL